MKTRFGIILSILLLNGCANSETINGFWSGTMEMNGKTIDISMDLNPEKGIFSSYDIMILEQPVSDLTIKNETISFSIVLDVEAVFIGKLSDDQITGSATIDGMPPNMNIAFSLTKQLEKPEKPYHVESLTIKNNEVVLSADIYKPETPGVHPAIVLLPGSNRDNPKRNLAFHADYFVKLGFEVLIYDKRGSGKSTGDSLTATYEDLTSDAIACLEILAKGESVNPQSIGLWGLSQGGMLLPYIVSKTEIPSFIICVSPEITGVYEAAAFSDSLRVVRRGCSPDDGHIVAESHRKVAQMISNGNSCKEVEGYINRNAGNYNYMTFTGLYDNINIDAESFKGVYWSGRTYNFYKYWQNLNIKTLCLFGADDDLVDPVKNVKQLNSLENENIQTFVFANANHVLKKTFNPSQGEIDWPRLIKGYSGYVEKWLNEEVHK